MGNRKFIIAWKEQGKLKTLISESNSKINNIHNRLKHEEKLNVSQVFEITNTLPTKFYIEELLGEQSG